MEIFARLCGRGQLFPWCIFIQFCDNFDKRWNPFFRDHSLLLFFLPYICATFAVLRHFVQYCTRQFNRKTIRAVVASVRESSLTASTVLSLPSCLESRLQMLPRRIRLIFSSTILHQHSMIYQTGRQSPPLQISTLSQQITYLSYNRESLQVSKICLCHNL